MFAADPEDLLLLLFSAAEDRLLPKDNDDFRFPPSTLQLRASPEAEARVDGGLDLDDGPLEVAEGPLEVEVVDDGVRDEDLFEEFE